MIVKEIILNAIATVNDELKISELEEVNEKTNLFTLLDSLGTLDLILELESLLENETGQYIAIANEYSMDKESTPFKNIVILENYIQQRVTDA